MVDKKKFPHYSELPFPDSKDGIFERAIPLGTSGCDGLQGLCQDCASLSSELDALADSILNGGVGRSKGKGVSPKKR